MGVGVGWLGEGNCRDAGLYCGRRGRNDKYVGENDKGEGNLGDMH